MGAMTTRLWPRGSSVLKDVFACSCSLYQRWPSRTNVMVCTDELPTPKRFFVDWFGEPNDPLTVQQGSTRLHH